MIGGIDRLAEPEGDGQIIQRLRARRCDAQNAADQRANRNRALIDQQPLGPFLIQPVQIAVAARVNVVEPGEDQRPPVPRLKGAAGVWRACPDQIGLLAELVEIAVQRLRAIRRAGGVQLNPGSFRSERPVLNRVAAGQHHYGKDKRRDTGGDHWAISVKLFDQDQKFTFGTGVCLQF